LAALYRVIFGSDTDPALRPMLAINFAGSLATSTVFSFVGIWAIKRLGADQTLLGLAYLVSALIGVGSGYLGGHLSDHIGRRPLIFAGWIGQTAVVLGFVAAGGSATAGPGRALFWWPLLLGRQRRRPGSGRRSRSS
jgi:predicted MFS family arabinose efflux permease